MSQESLADPAVWPPGTVKLEQDENLLLHPTPTSDPNDPLNWHPARKAVNFALVSLYNLLTFVQLDVGFTAWDQYTDELGFSYGTLNGSVGANYLGLALGCLALVPLVHKLGRRPVYLFSAALQLGACVWAARTNSVADLYVSNVLSGLGGAIAETIVQITIVDLFYIHHHASANGLALLATFTGAYLGPVASGYIVVSQGWRWVWWWCVLLFGINLVFILLFFEETKFQQHRRPEQQPSQHDEADAAVDSPETLTCRQQHVHAADATDVQLATVTAGPLGTRQPHIDTSIPLKSILQRLAFVTVTEGSILHDMYEPLVILFTFPAIAYTAVAYGVLLAWFAVLISVQATFLYDEPYYFSAIGVGQMNIAPFIASIPGVLLGGYFNDKAAVWQARRNNGVYEPEMRLWMILPLAVVAPVGILMFGLGLDYGVSWPLLAVGFGIYGFCLTTGGVISLSYAMDCYQDVIGNALVGVTLIRNLLIVAVSFVLTPWINGMGVRDTHILIAALTAIILAGPVLLIRWGKRARVRTAPAYRRMALRQPTRRMTK